MKPITYNNSAGWDKRNWQEMVKEGHLEALMFVYQQKIENFKLDFEIQNKY